MVFDGGQPTHQSRKGTCPARICHCARLISLRQGQQVVHAHPARHRPGHRQAKQHEQPQAVASADAEPPAEDLVNRENQHDQQARLTRRPQEPAEERQQIRRPQRTIAYVFPFRSSIRLSSSTSFAESRASSMNAASIGAAVPP